MSYSSIFGLRAFDPLKSRYRTQIVKLVQLDEAAKVKKWMFVSCYHLASMDTFNNLVLRSSRKAFGLIPWIPDKDLDLSQASRHRERL